jgi:hypothetical protein
MDLNGENKTMEVMGLFDLVTIMMRETMHQIQIVQREKLIWRVM